MKAIILAAGEGTRLRPLTFRIPKALVKVGEKTILEHNLESLKDFVDEFIIVVSYKKELVKELIGNDFEGKKVTYHEQKKEFKGTGGAVKGIETNGNILILACDTIFDQKDIEKLLNYNGYGALCKRVSNPEKYGVFEVDENNFIKNFHEKPKEFIGDLSSLLYFKVNSEVIKFAENIPVSPRGEYELNDAILEFIDSEKFGNSGENSESFKNSLKAIEIENDFIDITSLEDLEKINKEIYKIPEFGKSEIIGKVGEFDLHFGIRKDNLEELVKFSLDENDEAIQNFTGDKKRFSSLENIENWYKIERFVYTLVSENGKLGGIVWYRKGESPEIEKIENEEIFEKLEKFKNYLHTSGVRLYDFARGKGLSKEFIEKSENHYKKVFPAGFIVIDTNSENIGMIKSAEKNNYEFVGFGQNKKSVLSNEKEERLVFVKEII